MSHGKVCMKRLLLVFLIVFNSTTVQALELSDNAINWKNLCSGELSDDVETSEKAIATCTMTFIYWVASLNNPNVKEENKVETCVAFDIEDIADEFVLFMENNKKFEVRPVIEVLPLFFELRPSCDT